MGHEDREAPATDEQTLLQLRPHIGPQYALSWPHLLVSGFFALLFLFANHNPLNGSDLWGEVSYGEWILNERRLPAEDPFVPLAAGMPIVDTEWLGQVAFGGIVQAGGEAWLSHVFAIVVLLTYVVLFAAAYQQTRRIGVALLTTIIILVLAFSRLLVMRPEVLASLCCAILLLIVVRLRRSGDETGGDCRHVFSRGADWSAYLFLPAIMAVWANVDGSFFVGLAIVWCHFLGRAIDAVVATRNLKAALSDRLMRRWLLLSEFATVAVLLNPYGIDLLIGRAALAVNANLADVPEWQPLRTVSLVGWGMLVSWGLLLLLLRCSRKRVRPADVLLIAVFTAAVWFRVRNSVWYAYVYGIVIAPHLADLVSRKWPAKAADQPPVIDKRLFGRTYIHTLACALLLWIGLALSPIFTSTVGGSPRTPEQLHDRRTPLGVTAFLRQHPPAQEVYAPQWWGGWLVWDGPPGLKPFVTTNTVAVVPRRVWLDNLRILAGEPGWQRTLEKYRVQTIVVHKDEQRRLESQVRQLPADWQIVYEDDLALVVSRDKQLLSSLSPKGKRTQ